jgi:hypothetical protein
MCSPARGETFTPIVSQQGHAPKTSGPDLPGTDSGMHGEFWIDLTASSAVNFPLTRARLRLVVIWTGVRSIRSTYSRSACTTAAHFHDKFRDVRMCHSRPLQKR